MNKLEPKRAAGWGLGLSAASVGSLVMGGVLAMAEHPAPDGISMDSAGPFWLVLLLFALGVGFGIAGFSLLVIAAMRSLPPKGRPNPR